MKLKLVVLNLKEITFCLIYYIQSRLLHINIYLECELYIFLIVNIAISAGDVTFSIIGGEEARHFVIFGSPIEELKHAKSISLPNDLILSMSAWQHCTSSQYEYVIKDAHNIKVQFSYNSLL